MDWNTEKETSPMRRRIRWDDVAGLRT